MIGSIYKIDENSVNLVITDQTFLTKDLIDQHIIFEGVRTLVGKIVSANAKELKIVILGEFINNSFVAGGFLKPNLGSSGRLATKEETNSIISGNISGKKLLIGTMPLYSNEQAYASTNNFFSNHFAIFGNSGSGKSCGVARIIQNVFNSESAPLKSSIFIFDAFGEYQEAFTFQNPNVNFKRYTTDIRNTNTDIIKIPLWLLGIDDIALLLNADDQAQLPIIEKALRLVTIFAKQDDQTRIYKNDIIARAILDVLYSGRPAAQLRDQIFAILTQFNTPNLNLDTKIVQPGYVRELRKCLIIDKDGKIQDMQLISEFFNSYLTPNLQLELPDGTISYNLNNLKDALDFALISEGVLKSDKVFDKANILKVRLNSLINSEYAYYFNVTSYISKFDFIKQLLLTKEGKRAQIINININYLDDRMAKTICKIYSKLLFDFVTVLENRGSIPIHILVEEAHRYIQNDKDIDILGYNIFDRITKEGRKYGIILGMISQRPSELSETAISQCSNLLVFKMIHPKDVDFIKTTVPNISLDVIDKLKNLAPGTCIAFGSAWTFPVVIKLELPNPIPKSNNVDISKVWY